MSSLESNVTALLTGLRFLTQENAHVATLDMVLDMQQQLAELHSARKVDAREIRQAEVQMQKLEKEVQQQRDQIASLSTMLQEKESGLADIKAQQERERTESREAFSLITAELEAKTGTLEELENYTSKLQSASSPRV
jgi:septal ring factor EnvC (AmiA/AmiB activator)